MYLETIALFALSEPLVVYAVIAKYHRPPSRLSMTAEVSAGFGSDNRFVSDVDDLP
jgi:hypothetical protein